MTSDKVIHLSDANFDEKVLKNELPVFVEFWAAWCGPCQMIAPFLEELATEYNGRLIVAKLDVDENQEEATKNAIRSIPTFIIFKNGEAVDEYLGADPEKIKQMVDKAIG